MPLLNQLLFNEEKQMSDVHLITGMFTSVDRLTEIMQIRQIPFRCAKGLNTDMGIPSYKCEIIIISDGSTDSTGSTDSSSSVEITPLRAHV